MATNRPSRSGADDARRDQLVNAAIELMARDGLAAATTRRIAEEAGVPLGLVHYWFAGKDELFAAVSRAVIERLRVGLTDGIDTSQPVPEVLVDAFSAIRSDGRGTRLAMFELAAWVLRNSADDGALRERLRESWDVAGDTADSYLKASGREVPEGVSPRAVAQLLTAVFDGLTFAWLTDPDDAGYDHALRLLGRMLATLLG